MDHIIQAAEQNQDGAIIVGAIVLIALYMLCHTVKYVINRIFPATTYEEDTQ